MTPPDQLPIYNDTDKIPLLPRPSLESHSDHGDGQLPGRPGQPFKFGDLGDMWKHVDELTNEYHDDFVKELKDNLDNLLIFAALFSAVNSTFMGFSLPNLSPGPADQTNKLLKLMLQGYNNSTLSPDDLNEDPFTPAARDILINQYFCISLAFSLIASFGALLGQQWVIHYNKRKYPAGSALERWERQRKMRAARRWQLQPLVDIVLPGLLQIALFIFMIGFIYLLYELNTSVATPITILTALAVFVYLLAALAPARDPYCPFQTSAPEVLSAFLGWSFGWVDRSLPKVSASLTKLGRSLQTYLSPIRRKPEPIPVLTIGSACQILETSEDRKALQDIARNIPFLGDTSVLADFYHNRVAMSRIRELSSKETGDVTVFSEALAYLELTLKPRDARPPPSTQRIEQLLIFERAADGFIKKTHEPISFHPTSIATVTFVATRNLPLEAEMYSLRPHQEYLLASLTGSHSPLVTVGLVAWMLLSGKEFIPNRTQRRLVLADMGIFHPDRPDTPRQDLDDIIIALEQFEGLGLMPKADAQSQFIRFVLQALRNCHSQARNTHKFLVVLTTGLEHLLSRHNHLSWQTTWEDALFLIESLNTLLADSGSQARPLSGDVGEGESEDDWNQASQDAVNLMDAACEIIGRWKTPDKFSEAVVASDALLAPFAQYIKRLTQRYRNVKRPFEPLPFEGLAQSIQSTPRDRIACDDLIYAEFTNAWRLYQALPRAEKAAAPAHPGSFLSQGESSADEGHESVVETIVNDVEPVQTRPVLPKLRPSSLPAIPQWKMSPTQRYSRVPNLPDA